MQFGSRWWLRAAIESASQTSSARMCSAIASVLSVEAEPLSGRAVMGPVASGRLSGNDRDRSGRPPDEVAYDYITEADGQYLFFPVVNYVTGDHAPIHEMMNDPACLLGLSDGGAHCTSIVDSGLPSFMLAHWGRDRRRGPRLPLEFLV